MADTPAPVRQESSASRRAHLVFKVGLAGVTLLLIIAVYQIPRWREEAVLRLRRESLAHRIANVKASKTDCIYNPDPKFIEDIVQDTECAEKLTNIYISEQFPPNIPENRYAALKKLPHVKTIWVCYTSNADPFLDDIQGMVSLEEIYFDQTQVSVAGARHLTSCPNLKKICFIGDADSAVLAMLKHCPDIEVQQTPSAR